MQDQRGKHSHREILSQPETWPETLDYLQSDWESKIPNLNDYDEVIITGCGSTYYLSIWAARYLQKTTGVTCVPLPSSELWFSSENWINPSKKTLLIAISRSGQTTETLHALEAFEKNTNGTSLVITCYADSPLAKMTANPITTTAGMETSVAQTRSFTNMMWPIILLGEREIPAELGDTIRQSAQDLINAYQASTAEIGKHAEIERFFFLGSGPLYGLALEVMLKMKEMSLSYSEAYHFLEFRHGPMSMVNNNSLLVGLVDPKTREHEISVLKDMQRIGGRTLTVCGLGQAPQNMDYVFNFDNHIPENWKYPLYLPLIQLIAYERSISKGLNPDKPKNLTKFIEL